jgi:hypothetical protein
LGFSLGFRFWIWVFELVLDLFGLGFGSGFGLGFWVRGSGFDVLFGVSGFEFWVSDFGFKFKVRFGFYLV